MELPKYIKDENHLKNRIAWLQRILDSRPDPMYYDGDSDVAGDWVEQENRANEELSERIKSEIDYLNKFIK